MSGSNQGGLEMKSVRNTLFVILVLVVAVAAGNPHRGFAERPFLGLWEGVDVNDGSKRTVSITDRDQDGIVEVSSRDTFWTLCDGDRGLERATGGVRPDGVLETDGLVTCFTNGIEVPVQQTYEYSRREDTLFATPLGTGLMPVTLHRVSD
jgi:hypothetical protein